MKKRNILALVIILNEVRGLMVVASLGYAWLTNA